MKVTHENGTRVKVLKCLILKLLPLFLQHLHAFLLRAKKKIVIIDLSYHSTDPVRRLSQRTQVLQNGDSDGGEARRGNQMYLVISFLSLRKLFLCCV